MLVSWGKDKPTLSTKVSASTFQGRKANGTTSPRRSSLPTPPPPPTQVSLSRVQASLGSFNFFFKDWFWCGLCLKSLLNLTYNIASVLHFGFWPQGMWDLSSHSRTEPPPTALEGKVLATQPPGKSQEVLKDTFFEDHKMDVFSPTQQPSYPFPGCSPGFHLRDPLLAPSYHMISKRLTTSKPTRHNFLEFFFSFWTNRKGEVFFSELEGACSLQEAQRKEELA